MSDADWERSWRESQRLHDPSLLELFRAGLPERAQILDAGCGAGMDAILLAQAGYRVSAIDHSAPLLKVAAIHGEGHSILWQEKDIRLVSLPEASLDAIWFARVIESGLSLAAAVRHPASRRAQPFDDRPPDASRTARDERDFSA